MKNSLKSLILSLLFSLVLIFFFGVFMNGPMRVEYSQEHHFMINRGYPQAWAGVTALDKPLEFPLVKAPFLVKQVGVQDDLVTKIIDLKLLAKYVFWVTLFFSPFIFIFFKFLEKNSKEKDVFIFLTTLFLILFFLIYFLVFPRV
jgi:hypothetical protein